MRKNNKAACLIAALLSLCALPALAEESTADYAQQLPAFVNQVSVWKPKAKASYAYTDLDQDGSLEVLTSFTSKKGEVTNELWALMGGKLVECALPWGEDDPQTELKEDEVPVYFDEAENIYYYVFGTSNADGEATAVWLKDGALFAEALAEEPAVRFSDMRVMTASFGWISTAEHTLKDAPLEQLSELGGESVSKFRLQDAE